ncbi:quinone oxidoreductase family protein [Actinotalea fermentans]|uniref:Quinone oxidoreductase n=1 Tax=Actinotalea fermentans TaxID=43671 RepID=A0A511YVG5_9CELL|nr:quinone oxidoreductase [Actinotalea fermentans]KGM15203.1 NADPH--quinone reductase [Actinotalea fermentans ATCC 43279 = JCM 9966 = DSM 3133]GEN79201.1 quinone oxidoreductase [Actinotalea fermentans]
MRVVQATRPGGPEVLAVVDLPDPSPEPEQVIVEVAAAGVNFIDTYRRSGRYPVPFPHVVGSEGAGTVVAVGSDVSSVAVGDAVAWVAGSEGSYAERARVLAEQVVPVPDGVAPDTAAALLLQGITAHYLVRSTFPVQPGQDVLVHAGAGGVGLLLTQLAVTAGARVITTVSTEEKEALSRAAGAAEVIRYDRMRDLTSELPAAVRELTGGHGVHTVYDGVGASTFDASLASLRPRGALALFGGSSGAVPPFDPMRLESHGSLFLSRPTIRHYTATRDELQWRASELFDAVLAGTLDVRVGARFPLGGAADAHRALEGRATTGKVLIVPDGQA